MNEAEALLNKVILVIEDDYYQATDAASSLNKAGASVIGCTGSASEAQRLIDDGPIDCALVDINLGDGPRFETARLLRARRIPFLFTTGYDAKVIPSEFDDVICLQKPFDSRKLVGAVAALLT